MSGENDVGRALGRIEGKLDMIMEGNKATNERLDSMDERLRKVENKAAVGGALAGGIASVGTSLIVEYLRRVL